MFCTVVMTVGAENVQFCFMFTKLSLQRSLLFPPTGGGSRLRQFATGRYKKMEVKFKKIN